MLTRIRRRLEERDAGFTLIELLVVIIIIGILAAIAIPVFLNQRKKGYDARAKADARNMATLEETWLTDNNTYTDSLGAGTLVDFKPSAGTTTNAKANGANGFCIVSKSQSPTYFVYDSAAGGLQGGSYATFAAAAAAFPATGSCKVAAPASF